MSVSIKTYCTIVNTLVEKNGVMVSDPSGWDEAAVISNLIEANRIFRVAKVKFEFAGLTTLEFEGSRKDGKVDRTGTFEVIAAKIGARSFTRGEVHVAFIKMFAGGNYRGLSVQDWCYACVQWPDVITKPQRTWVLAHELGHLLGLGHNCTDQTRMMHYSWLFTVGHTISKAELAIIKAHPHVDPKATYVAQTEEEPACRG